MTVMVAAVRLVVQSVLSLAWRRRRQGLKKLRSLVVIEFVGTWGRNEEEGRKEEEGKKGKERRGRKEEEGRKEGEGKKGKERRGRKEGEE